MTPPLSSRLSPVPADALFALNARYQKDYRADKMNLGIGVYVDESGKLPEMKAVEAVRKAQDGDHSYLPIGGDSRFTNGLNEMLLGDIDTSRVVSLQTPGGTGALAMGARFLRHVVSPESRVYVSSPTWDNHRAIFENAGHTVENYPYLDTAGTSIDFEKMVDFLKNIPTGSTILLHACCHNPTGFDLTVSQEETIRHIVRERGIIPFLDIAYMGFRETIEKDARWIRSFACDGLGTTLVAASLSKSMGLYGERLGAFTYISQEGENPELVKGHLQKIARTSYSNPPRQGSYLARTIFENTSLKRIWTQEVSAQKTRLQEVRREVTQALAIALQSERFDHIARGNGMFSITGIGSEDVQTLEKEHGIYMPPSGRICLAGLNTGNAQRFVAAVRQTLWK